MSAPAREVAGVSAAAEVGATGTVFPTKRLKHVVALRRLRTSAGDAARPYVGLEDIESGTGRLANGPRGKRGSSLPAPSVTDGDFSSLSRDRARYPSSPPAPSVTDGDGEPGRCFHQNAGGSSSPSAPSVTDGNEATGTDFEPGDVLFGKLRPYLAKAWVAEFPGRCTTEALVMEPTSIEPRFLRSVCLSSRFVGDVDASTFGSKMPRADWDFIGNMPVPVPDADTQRAVADHLDRETARLDALVAAKRRLLELLAEKRRAVVTRAVTRGLDHARQCAIPKPADGRNGRESDDRLDDANAAIQAWPVKRVRFLVQRELSEEKQRILSGAEQATFLPMENIGEQGELDCSATRYVDDVRNGYTRFFDGDVLVAKITPCFENGKGALVDGMLNGIGFGTTELHVLTPIPEIDARWLYYTTISDRFRKLGEAAMFGAAGQKRVPEDFVLNYRVPVPPLREQRAIVDYLDQETARLEALMARVRQAIAFVEERRAALIAAAVTGRIAMPDGNKG